MPQRHKDREQTGRPWFSMHPIEFLILAIVVLTLAFFAKKWETKRLVEIRERQLRQMYQTQSTP